ncbi:hypothetical protein DEU56DRAFT_836359 [Suillus clintonianus]|uniref:uncharacterized protein n=1 Tax=Suillus clintonianus TaxID=1904413 RepID=UPI001B85BE32|nr:uncharacterized protein DEU56DRAFT_836359 [Suillus clintonianus]KAG2119410.1 hypothetical protein DEU56DRAFT_836359 [Suillus clintonianus]
MLALALLCFITTRSDPVVTLTHGSVNLQWSPKRPKLVQQADSFQQFQQLSYVMDKSYHMVIIILPPACLEPVLRDAGKRANSFSLGIGVSFDRQTISLENSLVALL